MKNIPTYLLLVAALTACEEPSADEKRVRQENAFDISGNYAATSDLGSEVLIQFKIENKSNRSDVLARIDRSSGLTEKESALLKEFGISELEFTRSFGSSLVLEAGYLAKEAGGSNVSDDFGKSSRLNVETPAHQIAGIEAVYRLKGTFKKEDLTFRGDLILELNRVHPIENATNWKEARMKVVASSNAAFWTQYFGHWSGPLVTDEPTLKSFSRLEVVKVDDATFRVVPEAKTLIYKGETFEFNEKRFPMGQLKIASAPIVECEWKSASGKQIQMTASIWSLGEFTGNLVYWDGTEMIPLGGFQFVLESR